MKIEETKPSNPDFHKGQISLLQDRVTLRDHFAGLAMQGIISNPEVFGVKTMFNDDIASLSYNMQSL